MVAVVTQRETWPASAVLAAAALAVAVVCWFVFSYGYIEDDAYIHLEFARSLAEGNGFAFNGQVTYGDTAPIWPLILAAIHALGFGWIASAKLAGAAGLITAVLGVSFLSRDLAADRPEQRLLPPAAVAVTVVNPYFVHWSFSGMESLAALGLSFWIIWTVFLRDPAPLRCLFGAALIGIAPLFRPELLLLDAIAGPVLLLRWWRARVVGQSAAPRLVMTAMLAVLMILPLAIWSGYALETFGAVVPNTNLAKRGGAIRELAPRLFSVYALGFPLALGLLPVAMLAAMRSRRAPLAVWVLLLWPIACIAFYLANHTLMQTRYCLLSMPSLSIAVLWFIGAYRRPVFVKLAAAGMLCAALAVIGLIVVPHVKNKEDYDRVLSAASEFIRMRIPPQSSVAVYAIGQIAFESRHPLVDIGGITQPSVIPFMGDAHATLRWARSRGAQYYIASELTEPDTDRVFTGTVPFIGWTLRRSLYGGRQPLSIYRLAGASGVRPAAGTAADHDSN